MEKSLDFVFLFLLYFCFLLLYFCFLFISCLLGSENDQLRVKYGFPLVVRIEFVVMFISIEKASQITGKSKNALYRLMAKGHINFVRCTKGKRFLEVAELRRVYGELDREPVEPTVTGGENLITVIDQMRDQLSQLSSKVDKQTALIESLSTMAPVQIMAELPQPVQAVNVLRDRPEMDPEWPPFITCYADLAKRDEIKARYEKT